jgi:hypothetical protein
MRAVILRELKGARFERASEPGIGFRSQRLVHTHHRRARRRLWLAGRYHKRQQYQ